MVFLEFLFRHALITIGTIIIPLLITVLPVGIITAHSKKNKSNSMPIAYYIAFGVSIIIAFAATNWFMSDRSSILAPLLNSVFFVPISGIAVYIFFGLIDFIILSLCKKADREIERHSVLKESVAERYASSKRKALFLLAGISFYLLYCYFVANEQGLL